MKLSRRSAILLLSSALIAFHGNAAGQSKPANYDEANVGDYTLPPPLVLGNGTKVSDAKSWQSARRPEVLRLFETHVYGRSPAPPAKLLFEVTRTDPQALGGKATRTEIAVFLTGQKSGPRMDLLLFLPNGTRVPAPAFLGLNFNGNHAVHPDPAITLNSGWMRNSQDKRSVVNNRATEASRGSEASRWPVELILSRGYALATIYYGDVEPDHAEGWKSGLRAALAPDGANTHFAPDAWGAIGAWAWGLSRALDVLEKQPAINARQVAVIGHSRLGKTSLWAGATDERFAITISNNSGEGGAALARRNFGETVERINTSFPHWFCGNFKQYNSNVAALPVDQHLLIALMAPRPVYIASAEKDQWADPRGEFLSGLHAEPVFKLLGHPGLGVAEMPGLNQPVGQTIGYHFRTGAHDVTDYDWQRYLDFADRHFGRGRK